MWGRWRRTTDFDDEIRAHLELEAERLQEERGLPPDAARAAARRTFGNVTLAAERFFESRRCLWWDRLMQDVRYGVRTLRRSPAFTVTAVLTIGIGIGATTAIFAVVDAALLRPLPYPHAEQLVTIQDDLPGIGASNVGMSQPEWQDLQRSGIFDGVSPTWYDDNNLTGPPQPARVSLLIVAPNYFDLLGVRPQIGCAFNAHDRGPGLLGEVVISDGLWRGAFGGDPAIVGRSLRLDTDLYRIVGVMPPGFEAPGATPRERRIEVWASTNFYGTPMLQHPPRSGRNLPTAIARLGPGLSIAEAQQRVDALVAALHREFPADYPPQSAWTVRLIPLKESVVGRVRPSLLLLLGAVCLVLLIACVNVANLTLARTSARGRELAIRSALGGGRGRLVRQLLTENVLVSLLGGAVAFVTLVAARTALLGFVPANLPRVAAIAVSGRVVLFALATSALVGAAFGLIPALSADRFGTPIRLKQEGRGTTGGAGQVRTRQLLVITEFGLALALMIAAALLLRSFRDLVEAPLGFQPHQVMAIKFRLPYPNDPSKDVYGTAAQQAPLLREVLRRVAALPGVDAAAIGDVAAIPLDHDRSHQTPPVPLLVEGRERRGSDIPLVDSAIVTPGYFRLMGITLTRGRLFDALDTDETAPVAVVNDAAARAYWPGENPIGRHLRLSRSAGAWTTIVGVVADARVESLERPSVPEVYTDLHQDEAKHLAIFLRGQIDPAAIADGVRAQVQAVDRTLPVFGGEMIDETVEAALAARRFALEMVGAFALTALTLAAVGIYGVLSYVVSERTYEIGIRLALGAESRAIVRMLLRQGAALTAAGAAVGLVCGAAAARLMARLLYGVRPIDPPTFAAVAAVFAAVALLACYVPARRVLRVDPLIALRDD